MDVPLSCSSAPPEGIIIIMPEGFATRDNALAYLMGVYLSDGHTGVASGRFGLTVTDEVFRDEAAKALRVAGSTYGLSTYPSFSPGGKKVFRLREHSPFKVGRWLEEEFPGGKDHLPRVPDSLVRDLVAGILDGDGSIFRQKRQCIRLKVCGYSDYLADLQELFEKFSIVMHFRAGKETHYINLRSFVEAGFYFRMPRKQALVNEYITRFID